MGARQSVALLAAAICLAAAVGAAVGGATTDANGTAAIADAPAEARSQPRAQQVTADTVVLDVRVYENGSAKWEVIYRTRLNDPNTTAAFRSYKKDIEQNPTKYSRQFVDRMDTTLQSAANSTGRNMTGTNYSVRAEIREFPQRYGRVIYSFTWHGFADVSGDRIRIGDSLSGLILNEKTRLLVQWPEGYEAVSIQPKPDPGYEKRERAVIWNGPIEFASNKPRIVLAESGVGGPDVPLETVAAAAGALALLAALAGGTWWYRNREEQGEDAVDEPPEDLLSNEERVLRLLERRGGRVKQKAVVDELGWTEAKTSQVVGSLREQGKIESFRLGRENVLALAKEQQES